MAEVQEISPEHGHLEWETPLYRTALAQYEQALPHADVEEFVAERLRYPERSLVVSVPVRLDNGWVWTRPGVQGMYRIHFRFRLADGCGVSQSVAYHNPDPPQA